MLHRSSYCTGMRVDANSVKITINSFAGSCSGQKSLLYESWLVLGEVFCRILPIIIQMKMMMMMIMMV
jgi:hypothetical protein